MVHFITFSWVILPKFLLLSLSTVLIYVFIRFLPEARKCDFFARHNAGELVAGGFVAGWFAGGLAGGLVAGSPRNPRITIVHFVVQSAFRARMSIL
jgi:hypothetical protein